MGWADEIHCKMFISEFSEGFQLTLGKGIYQTKRRRGSFLKFNFEVIRLMWSRSRGAGFIEDISELMVVWWCEVCLKYFYQKPARNGLYADSL